MRLRFKLITLIISMSLLSVLGYQLYWLINFYNDQYEKMGITIEKCISNAFILEVTIRLKNVFEDISEINTDGTLTFSMDLSNDRDTVLYNQNIADSGFVEIQDSLFTIKTFNKPPDKNKIDISLTQTMEDIAITIMDNKSPEIMTSEDFIKFDSLLNNELKSSGIDIEYYIDYVNENDSIIKRLPADFDVSDTNKYVQYTSSTVMTNPDTYRLYFKQPRLYVFKEMWGLLIISFLMIVLLIISYLYLLKIIWKQKTIDKIKSDFINNITHELKTPISVTYAAIDALQNFGIADDTEKRDKYLSISKEQLMSLNSLVEQILTMSVEERKNIKLVPEEINISELFETLKYQFLLNSPKDIIIETDVDPGLSIIADKIHFINIMNNLIENAIKYSYEKVKIVLSAHIINEITLISVCDNGIGIPKECQDKVFERFYRVSKGNIHDVKGYGLGLFYVRTIIDRHNWNIEVNSTEGKGSCFKIYIK